jgi:diguanylate cyclase (GGDEF)-like protein
MTKKTITLLSAKDPQVLQRLGLQSLRSRYIIATVSVSLILTLAAGFGWHYVENTAVNQLGNIQHRTAATNAMANAVTHTHTLETQIYRFITLPSATSRRTIEHTFTTQHSAIRELTNNEWIRHDAALLQLVAELEKDHLELEVEISQLLDVRTDDAKWFPALSLMQNKMLTYNMQFMSSLELLNTEVNNDLSDATKLEIYKLSNETRYYWQLMIGEFRLFVANSFGVFSSDPERGIATRKANIELYSGLIDDLLAKLAKHGRHGDLDIVSDSSLQEMQYWFKEWKSSYKNVSAKFDTEMWRQDLVLLRERIEPKMLRINQHISNLQLALGAASTKDITHLTGVARHFSDFIIFLSAGVIAAGLLGFFIFHRAILRPISRIAQALKDEASGQHKTAVPLSSAEEIRALTNAFAEMREQIRTREAHLDHMAHHDALTQLPNRILFHYRLEQSLAKAIRNGTQVGLLFLDLDRFKQINDSLGHDTGDKLLQIVSKRLHGCLRATDMIARLGGDEFAIIIENVTQPEQLATTARKLLKEFTSPFLVDHHEIHTSTSIGIACGPKDSSTIEILVKNADIAMYHAKAFGRNLFKFYSNEMAEQMIEHVTLEAQLRHAIEYQEFELYYQPIVEVRSGRMISTEALLRWHHPGRGLISPDEFLPVLVESGLIKPVTQWALIEAGKQYSAYVAAGHANIRTSVNLTGFVFRNDSILDVILSAIEHSQMEPKGLILEVTEDTLQTDMQSAQQALNTLQKMGIQIALDDFGTGQSSLNHLRHNPINIVKIDRDYIKNIPTDKSDSELVDAIIAMAHKLHIKVVAEGVETKAQLDFLHWHKCDAIQGYFFSHPLPAAAILEMLAQDKRMLG